MCIPLLNCDRNHGDRITSHLKSALQFGLDTRQTRGATHLLRCNAPLQLRLRIKRYYTLKSGQNNACIINIISLIIDKNRLIV